MSFTAKLTSLMARPGEDAVPKDEVPWWLKYSGRGLGTVAGFFLMFLGAWNLIGIIVFNTSSLIAGIWQLVSGFATLCIEAPCCCLFVEYVQTLSDFIDKKPYYYRAAGYMLIALPPPVIYFGFTDTLACALLFGTGVLYGMMALGKKGSPEDMRTAAIAETAPKNPSTVRSNLVAHAQPLSFTGSPVLDSNV